MATLRDIKRRIVGVSNTQQITKAMKMVAAAKLRRAQDNIVNARPYTRRIREVLNNLLAIEKNIDNFLLAKREPEKVALVILSSDNGLCGAFNMNIIRKVEDLLKDEYSEQLKNGNVELYFLGKKAWEYFKRRNYEIADYKVGIFKELKFDIASNLVAGFVTKFANKQLDKVVIVYNEFKSVMQQNLIAEQLLPIEFTDDKIEDEPEATNADFIYEPDKLSIINTLLPKHVNALLWKAMLESYAAELGARMTAMDLATENAKELIKELKLSYNKARQSAITKEILEIVGGADALKSE